MALINLARKPNFGTIRKIAHFLTFEHISLCFLTFPGSHSHFLEAPEMLFYHFGGLDEEFNYLFHWIVLWIEDVLHIPWGMCLSSTKSSISGKWLQLLAFAGTGKMTSNKARGHQIPVVIMLRSDMCTHKMPLRRGGPPCVRPAIVIIVYRYWYHGSLLGAGTFSGILLTSSAGLIGVFE